MNAGEETSAARAQLIIYDLTRGDLFIGFLTVILRNRMLQIIVLSFLVVSEIVVITFGLGSGLFSSAAVGCVFYAVVYCVLLSISLACMSLAMAYLPKERGVVGQHILEITEQGLVERTTFNESMHKWPAICRIVSQFGYLYIYVSYGVYHQVPKRRVPAREMTDFETQLQARISNYNG
jgi:hypothetical protein